MASRLYKLKDGELARLLRVGGRDGILCEFGPGWVGIRWDESQPVPTWMAALAALRGVESPRDLDPELAAR